MTTKAQNSNSLNTKPKDSTTYGEKRRQERQEALREFLQGQKYIEAIHNTLELDITNDELPAIKFKTETRLKLLNKVLPDLKAIEQTVDMHAEHEVYAWQE